MAKWLASGWWRGGTPWSRTFGNTATVHALLPFSLRVGFEWNDRLGVVEEALRTRLGEGVDVAARSFAQLGLQDLPESYRRRHKGWLRIVPPPDWLQRLDARRHAILASFPAPCPRPLGPSRVEILLASSGLGAIRVAHDVEWTSPGELRQLHAAEALFIQSYFKQAAREALGDDMWPLLESIRAAVLDAAGGRRDPRHELTLRYGLTWPTLDFYVGLVVCEARPGAPDPPRWAELLTAEEVTCVTRSGQALSMDDVLGCDALLVVGWDESLLAFAGAATPRRDAAARNAVQLFTLAAIQWTGLYDTDQMLYEALPALFRRGQAYTKLQLIRGVIAHLAQLQHESKVAYLAEHMDNQKLLARAFVAWETDNLVSNLATKSATLSAIVDRLNEEKLRTVGVFFTVLSLVGIVSNLGQHRQWDQFGWMWSGVAIVVALVGWLVMRYLGRS